MSDITYTGDLEGISQRHLDFISEVIEEKGFKPQEVAIENVGQAGDNYMGNVIRVIVKEHGKTTKMIVKIAPNQELMRQIVQVPMLYRNEMKIYNELLPKYREIQKSAGVKDLYRTAECYACLDEEPNETIILEDLTALDYEIMNRFEPLSDEALRIYMKNIAVYHSLSFVLRSQEPETFDEIKSQLIDLLDGPKMETEEGMMYFRHIEDYSLSVLTDENHKKRVKGSNTNTLKFKKELDEQEKGSKYTVIQQGDGWTNNIMYKLKARNDGVPTECVLIDFQMSRERSPAFDLMYMIFNSTSYEQRQKHYFEYLDLYHAELDLSLRNYGLAASEVYPREQLDSDLKRYGKLMLATNLMVSNSILKKPEEAQKMNDMMKSENRDDMDEKMEDMFQVGDETRGLLKTRIEGIVDSFVEYGYID